MSSRVQLRPAFTKKQIDHLCASTRMTDVTREVLYQYYNEPWVSQQEIADRFGIVHARVSQAVIRFEDHVHKLLKEKQLKAYTGFYNHRDLKIAQQIDQFGTEAIEG